MKKMSNWKTQSIMPVMGSGIRDRRVGLVASAIGHLLAFRTVLTRA